YFIEHRDGFRTTMILLSELLQDFNYAGRLRGTNKIVSCQFYLPMPPARASLADFFNPLVNHIETMILENRAPYPIERTLLTSGMVMAGVESLFRKGARVETPDMAVLYDAPRDSHFWRT